MIAGNRTKRCVLLWMLWSGLVFLPAVAQEIPPTPDAPAAEAEDGFMQGLFKIIQGFLEKNEQDRSLLQEGPPPLLNPQYLPLGTFVVNLQDGKFFLKTTITLVFAEPDPKTWLEKRLPVIKDMLITQLGRLSARRLREGRFRARLRNELRIKINSFFPNNPSWGDARPVKKVLFEEFYTQ